MQTEELLCWSGMTDTEHGATSGSNEVVVCQIDLVHCTCVQYWQNISALRTLHIL